MATAVYSGYDRFQSAEMNFGIQAEEEREYARTRKTLRAMGEANEAAQRGEVRYGGSTTRAAGNQSRPRSFGWLSSGMIVVSCEGGDIRITPTGLVVYGEENRERIELPLDETGRDEIVRQFYAAAVKGDPAEHDARWSRATLAVCLGVQRSATEGGEVILD